MKARLITGKLTYLAPGENRVVGEFFSILKFNDCYAFTIDPAI